MTVLTFQKNLRNVNEVMLKMKKKRRREEKRENPNEDYNDLVFIYI